MISEIVTSTLIAELQKGIRKLDAFINGKLNHIPITMDLIIYRFKKWHLEYPTAVGFVIVEFAQEGNYSIVQGMIDQETNEVYTALRVEATDMGDKAKELLLNGPNIKIFPR